MTTLLYVATAMGLYIAAQVNGQWLVQRHVLADHSLTSVDVSAGSIVAGTRDGVWRSVDGGRSWRPGGESLSIRHVRWIKALSSDKPVFLAGTEPAAIFISRDSGLTWTLSTEVTRLRDQFGWFLPYSPEAGCVRGFAVETADREKSRIYAAVEVGGVLLSEDRGRSWQLADGSDGKPRFNRDLGTMIHPDVHSITVHPRNREVITAPTGGGLYRSTDGGSTWRLIHGGYIRAVWVDPADQRRLVAGPADGVSRNGRIEITTDGGVSWQSASQGLQVPWPRHMVERFVRAGEVLFAVLSNGELWAADIHRLAWQRVLPEISDARAVAVSPG